MATRNPGTSVVQKTPKPTALQSRLATQQQNRLVGFDPGLGVGVTLHGGNVPHAVAPPVAPNANPVDVHPQQINPSQFSSSAVVTGGRANVGANGMPATRPAAAPKQPKQATNVASMQKFLAGHGYQIPVDGQNGPLTQAAAADFRGSRNPVAFNVGHGLVHDTSGGQVAPVTPTAQPVQTTPAPAPKKAPAPARTTATATAPAAGGGQSGVPAGPTLGSQAQSIVDKIIAAETKRIVDAENARSQTGSQAIQGYTQAQQALLGTYSPLAASAYGGAKEGQNAIDAALAAKLSGAGDQLGQELGAKLAAISADPQTAARLTSGLAQTSQGASNAAYAKGSASLSALNNQGAAAGAYADGLPGVASLAGLQSLRGLQGTIATDQATQLGNLRSQVPTMTQNALGQLTTAKSQADANKLTAIFAAGYDPKTGTLNPAARNALAGLYPGLSPAALSGAPKGTVTKPAKAPAPSKLQFKVINGHGVAFDPSTGATYIPGTNTPVDTSALKKPPKPVSPSKLQAAKSFVQQSAKGYYAYTQQDTKPLSPSQLASLASRAHEDVPTFMSDQQALQAAGLGYYQHGQHEDQAIQQLYVSLVKDYGLPARQAFNLVAGTYRQWGQSKAASYFPKAG